MDFGGAKTNRRLFRAGTPPRLTGRSAERSEVRVQSSGSSHVLRTAGKARPGLFIPENAFGWDYDTISASLCSCYANKQEAQKSEARNEP